jgi:hypothetical protein
MLAPAPCETAPSKVCTQCHQDKPLTEYHRNCGSRRPNCKVCQRARNADTYARRGHLNAEAQKDYQAMKNARRYARKAGTPEEQNTLTIEELREIIATCRGRCSYCDRDNGTWELDHIVALNAGGPNTAENVTLSCRRCNVRKRKVDGSHQYGGAVRCRTVEEIRAWMRGAFTPQSVPAMSLV